jgi:hypothetical protein
MRCTLDGTFPASTVLRASRRPFIRRGGALSSFESNPLRLSRLVALDSRLSLNYANSSRLG